MHSYLLIGNDTYKEEKKISERLNGKIYEFSLLKIDDARQLSNFLKFSYSENTIIVSRNIDQATPEALNAFLKSLEEPQQNVSFILTATNEHKVIPTILSRCLIVRAKNGEANTGVKQAKEFIESPTGSKMSVIEKIKGRTEAIDFVQSLIDALHSSLFDPSKNLRKISLMIENLQTTLNNLNANGNVGLQLTNLVVNLDSGLKDQD